MAGADKVLTLGLLPVWAVIKGEPLDIDYDLIYKGFNDALSGQAESALINILIAALVCWGFWLLMRWFFRRDEERKIISWKRVETIRPDYQYKASNQKRQWMRIEAEAGFTFWLLDQQGKVMDKEIHEQLLDLSAGGLSFYTNEILDIDKQLHIQLNLGKPPILKLTGRVARVQFSPQGVEKRYMIGVQFIGIRPGEQDRIIKYTLSRQRKIIEEQKRQEEICPVCGQLLPFDEIGEFLPCPNCLENEGSPPEDEDEAAAAEAPPVDADTNQRK